MFQALSCVALVLKVVAGCSMVIHKIALLRTSLRPPMRSSLAKSFSSDAVLQR